MIVLGITGSSGSGKTTLSKTLNERDDIEVIDSDKIVREMSVPGNEYLNSIKATFGDEVILPDGNLNRGGLANKIYNDNEALNAINKLTFKYVVDEILFRLKNIDNEKIKITVIDAPLLFESGLNKHCDYIISLIADENIKIQRICKRDNLDEKRAQKRLAVQQNDFYYIEKSDFVIVNSQNCDLKLEFENILKQINNI